MPSTLSYATILFHRNCKIRGIEFLKEHKIKEPIRREWDQYTHTVMVFFLSQGLPPPPPPPTTKHKSCNVTQCPKRVCSNNWV